MKSSASRTLIFLALMITACTVIVSAVTEEFGKPTPQPKEPQSIVSEEGLININTADVELLTQLVGVGPSIAQRIISYRNENGLFHNIEDIMNIKGIGEKTFEKMRDQLCI